MRNLFLTAATTLAACLALGQAPAPAAPDVDRLLARMEQAQSENRARFTPYMVTRQYKLFNQEGARPSEVLAEITFQPPDQKQYQIRRTSGSGSCEKVVRRVLDREAEMTRRPAEIEISRNNYDFTLLRTEQLGNATVYVLELHPKRADKNLLKGVAYVDAKSYRIRRLVGHPAKNPSWLIKDLQLTLTFDEVQGMWMQTASEAVANVRFVGRHVFTSQDVNVQTAEQVAQVVRPRRNRARSAAAGLGAGVLR